jgi:hypothetical protein
MSNLIFELIRVDGGVKSMKHLKGGSSYKRLGTSGVFEHVKTTQDS